MAYKSKEEANAYNREWRRRNPERSHAQQRRAHLKKTFGMSPEEYDAMSAAQGHVCAICGGGQKSSHSSGKTWELCVDHDHVTGEVRGLLCDHCNKALGLLRDDARLMLAAAAYLEGAQV